MAQFSAFSTYTPLCDTCNHELNFRFESASFLQNNEYFNPFTFGLTGIGFYAQPMLEYYFFPNLKVNAGLFALKFSGLNKFSEVIPIFSVQYQPVKTLEIIFGNIFGTLNHKLEQPLFSYDRFYTHHVEYGIQFLYNQADIRSDLWLNWVHYITQGDPNPERLTVGNNTLFNLFSNQNNTFRVDIPLQWLIVHRGTQLTPGPHYVTTLMDGLSGLNFNMKIKPHFGIRFQQLFAYYYGKQFAGAGLPGHQLFKNGFGYYSKLRFTYRNLNLMTGYWFADRFIAPKGAYLFQSVSELNPDYSEAIRKLWTTKIWYSKTIRKSLSIVVRFSTYYDLISKHLDYSYAFYLLINQNFFLFKYKH